MYSKALKTILLSSILLTTSGCASFLPSLSWGDDEPTEVVRVQTVEVQVPITHPTLPRAISLKSPKWKVVSKKNLEEFLTDMEKQNGALVFVAMSVGDYELMAYNMQEIRRYVNQLKEVVIYYRTMTDKPEGSEDATTKSDTGKP